MKRFILKTALFCVASFAALVFVCFCFPDVGMKRSMLGVELKKRSVLRDKPGPRIVFVGGSSVAHGIDSKLIEKKLGRPVVNMGLHAGLGICYNMASALPCLHKGDVVFLLPEYSNYYDNNCYGNMETLAMVADVISWKDDVHLSNKHWFYLMSYIPMYGARKIKNLRQLLIPQADSTAGYDEFGDYVAGRNDPEQFKFMKEHPDLVKYEHIKSEGQFTPPQVVFIDELRSFIAACEKKGVAVWLSPPPLVRNWVDPRMPDAFTAMVREAGVPSVGNVLDYAFPVDCFYDTCYHLNNRGRAAAMERRIRDIISVVK